VSDGSGGRRRGGGRAGRIAARQAPLEADARPVRPGLPGGKFAPLSESEMQQVYDTALALLEDIGMGSPIEEFVDVVTAAGGHVDDAERLHYPKGVVEAAIATAAKEWVWHGFDDDRSITVGGDRVHFGTAGAAVPADLVVALVGRRGPDALPTLTTGVNEDGTFVFTDLPRTADAAYFAHVDYQGVSYATDGISFDGRPEVETTLTIYESTGQNPGIALESVARLLRHQTADAIAILDVIDVRVPGDRTFLPTASTAAPPPLRFAVPEGAFGLQPVSGFGADELVIGGPGFAVLAPLRPGVTTIAYAYQLRLIDGTASFDWLIGLPAGVVRLLSEQDVLATSPEGLAPQAATSFAGIAVDRWEARDVAARTTFAIEIADTTLPGIVRAIRSTTEWE